VDVQPVAGERALVARSKGRTVLVAGDLHLGLERRMAEEGWHVPSSTESIVSRLLALVRSQGVDAMVLAGDIKESLYVASRQEEAELPKAIGRLADSVGEIHLVKGNHDGDIEAWVPYRKNLTVHGGAGARLGELGVCHGHTWPSKEVVEAKVMVMGHNHPSVEFRDRLGHRLREPAWFRTRLVKERSQERYGGADPEVILMPPFNELLTGTPLNTAEFSGLGPMLARGLVDLDGAQVYLVDGIHLGRLGDLMPPEEREAARRAEGAG
jgi:putative SbcD/Mre11-related phosphoesterase